MKKKERYVSSYEFVCVHSLSDTRPDKADFYVQMSNPVVGRRMGYAKIEGTRIKRVRKQETT